MKIEGTDRPRGMTSILLRILVYPYTVHNMQPKDVSKQRDEEIRFSHSSVKKNAQFPATFSLERIHEESSTLISNYG